MKWGVRRYQDANGNLTDLGRERYRKHGDKLDRAIERKDEKAARKELDSMLEIYGDKDSLLRQFHAEEDSSLKYIRDGYNVWQEHMDSPGIEEEMREVIEWDRHNMRAAKLRANFLISQYGDLPIKEAKRFEDNAIAVTEDILKSMREIDNHKANTELRRTEKELSDAIKAEKKFPHDKSDKYQKAVDEFKQSHGLSIQIGKMLEFAEKAIDEEREFTNSENKKVNDMYKQYEKSVDEALKKAYGDEVPAFNLRDKLLNDFWDELYYVY